MRLSLFLVALGAALVASGLYAIYPPLLPLAAGSGLVAVGFLHNFGDGNE